LSTREDPFDRAEATSYAPDDPPIGGLVVDETEALSDAEGQIRSGKLAGKSLWAAIWILAMPVLLQQTMQACVGLFDKILAGRLPEAIRVPALDAIGIGSYIGWFIGIALAGLGIGGQAIIARAMGAGDQDLSHRALGQAITLSVLWGAIVGVALWFLVIPISHATGLTEEATRYCAQYVRIIAVSMPFSGVMMVGSMCLHGAGETAKPSAIAIGVNVVNVLASWIFSGADLSINGAAVENPFAFNWHVMGIAAGTALAFAFGAVATLYVLFRGVKDLRLELHQVRLERSLIGRIVRIGVPNFMEGISMWAVNLFILMFIGIIAEQAAAGPKAAAGLQGAHIISVQWEAFSFMPGFAIGTAAGALAGQYLGARNPRMARKAVLVCTAVAMVFMGLLGVVFMVGGEWLTSIVSSEPVHMENTPRLLFICGTVQVFFAITMVVRQGLRGVGDTKWTFIITTVSSYGVRLPAAYILGVVMGLGLTGIWLALSGEFVVRAILFSARFFRGSKSEGAIDPRKAVRRTPIPPASRPFSVPMYFTPAGGLC